MKRIFTLTCLCLLQLLCFAQNSGFYYQGVAKMKSGAPITNQSISIYISILSSSPDKLFYKESHSVKTDDAGRFSLVVGEGTEVQGKFIEVDWRSKELWIQTEMDAGMGVEDMGKSRILPVPVAAYALTALKTPYDYVMNTYVSTPQIKQGDSGNTEVGIQTYLYEHEPVKVVVDNKISGLSISPLDFTLLGNKQAITIKPGRNMPVGTYEIPFTAKAASGKERAGKFSFTVTDDSISKYLSGKWNVTVKRSSRSDTTYIEEIVVVDSTTIKFAKNIKIGGLPLLYNQIGKIYKINNYDYRLGIDNVPSANPSLSNVSLILSNLFTLKTFSFSVDRRYDKNPTTSTTEYHFMTFTKIE